MRVVLRIVAWTLLVVVIAAGVAYAASPWLIERIVPMVAERNGVRVHAIDVSRPTLDRWSVPLIELVAGEIDVRIEGLVVDYDLAALRAGRVRALAADTVRVADRSTAPGTFELPEELDTLWALVPSDRLDLPRVNVSSVSPEATLAGSFTFDPAMLVAAFVVDSPLLPTRLELDARIARAGTATVRMGAVGRADVLTVEAAPDAASGRLRLDAVVSLQEAAFTLAAKLAGAEPESGHVSAKVSGTLPWPLPEDVGSLAGSLEASGEADLAFVGLAPGYAAPIDFSGVLRAVAAGGNVEVKLADGGALRTADVAVALGAVDAAFQVASRKLTIARASATVSGPALQLRDDVALTRVRVDVVDAMLLGDTAQARLTIDTEVAAAGTKLAVVVKSRVARDGDRVTSKGTLALTKPGIELGFDARASLAARTVDGSVKGRIDVRRPLIASLLEKKWKEPGDVTAGAIELDVAGQWSAATPSAVSGRGRVIVHDVAAHWEEYTARDVNVDLVWRVDGTSVHAETTRLDVGEVDVGVPVTAISASVSCCERTIVRDIKARIFGGSITIPALEYSPEGSTTEATIDGISLAEVVALQGDKVSATGTLDGRLPLRIGPEGFVITAGRISARPPGGHIAYKDAAAIAASAGQPGLDFALRALTDFTYEALEGDIDYQADGTMTTKLRLRGRNPKVEAGRAIQYNLNITENVRDLLRSLRLADRVGEGIEKRFNN